MSPRSLSPPRGSVKGPVKKRQGSSEANARGLACPPLPLALGVVRSYLTSSFRAMVVVSLLLGVLLHRFRERWPEVAGALRPFPLFLLLYGVLFLIIETHSRRLMGRAIGWSGVSSPLFPFVMLRTFLLVACLALVKPLLAVHTLLAAVLGSLAVCLLVAAFFDSLRLLSRVKAP